jgi:DNA-binding MarR family transcriptional regulator
MTTTTDTGRIASELRNVIGRLVRRLRAEHRFPLTHGAVLGRLDREGPAGVSDLAAREGVKPQSMAQTVADLEGEGLVSRRPDPSDGRRMLVEMTETGITALQADRRHREGWLATAISEQLTDEEQRLLEKAVELLRRISES